MSAPKLLVPLRIPELGPSLGQLVTGTEMGHVGLTLDEFRFQLVTKLMEHAGEARRLAAGGERDAAVAALSRSVWIAVWEEAVNGVAQRLTETIEQRLVAEALAVRMPSRLRKRVAMTETEQRALAARLGAAGAGLIPALGVVTQKGAAAVNATERESAAVDEWQEALRFAARRLEAAWLALEGAVDREISHWQTVADALAAWRKTVWPVVVTGVVGAAVATWVGLVLGGFLSVPRWLEPVWSSLFAFLR